MILKNRIKHNHFSNFNKIETEYIGPEYVASWFCNGYTGKFGYGNEDNFIETYAPDRSKCIHQWIADVEKEVKFGFDGSFCKA